MRDYYSVQAIYNLLAWPAISWFADHLSDVSAGPAEGSGSGQHYSDSLIFHNTGCELFHSRLSCPRLPASTTCTPKICGANSGSCGNSSPRPPPRHRGE